MVEGNIFIVKGSLGGLQGWYVLEMLVQFLKTLIGRIRLLFIELKGRLCFLICFIVQLSIKISASMRIILLLMGVMKGVIGRLHRRHTRQLQGKVFVSSRPFSQHAQQFLSGGSLGWVDCQHMKQKLPAEWMGQALTDICIVHQLKKFKMLFHVITVNIEDGSCQHFVQDDSHCPDIALLTVGTLKVGFRCHISRRADVVVEFCILCVGSLAVAKVDDNRVKSRGQQDVLSFQISVDEVFFLDPSVSLNDTGEQSQGFINIQTLQMNKQVLLALIWERRVPLGQYFMGMKQNSSSLRIRYVSTTYLQLI